MTAVTEVPPHVVEALEAASSVELNYGVMLHPPTNRNGYRIECYDPPLRADGARHLEDRRQGYAVQLTKAWSKAKLFESELGEKLKGVYVEYRPGTVADVVESYIDPANHGVSWDESYTKQQKSLARSWILKHEVESDHSLLIDRNSVLAEDRDLLDLPIVQLTKSRVERILERVHSRMAHGTYLNVYKLLVSIIEHAHQENFLAKDVNPMQKVKRNPSPSTQPGRHAAAVDPRHIPDPRNLATIRAAALLLHGFWAGVLLDLLAWAGLRIGEALALTAGQFERLDDGSYCVHIDRRVMSSKPALRPPKWGRKRYAYIPSFLGDDLARLLEGLEPDDLLFPAPEGGLFTVTNFRKRRFNPWAEACGWPERPDYCSHQSHDPTGCVHDGCTHRHDPDTCDGQDRRRWRWPLHAFRHWCATWMLAPEPDGLGLDDKDAAAFLGHRDGEQLRRMYAEQRQDPFGRAAARTGSRDFRRATT